MVCLVCLQHEGLSIPLLVHKHVSVQGLYTLLENPIWEEARLGVLAPLLLGVRTQKGEGGETSSAGCRDKLPSGEGRKGASVETLHFLTCIF